MSFVLPQGGQHRFMMMPYENQTIIPVFSRVFSFNKLRTTQAALSVHVEPEPKPEQKSEPEKNK